MVPSVSDVASRTQRQITAAIAVGSELEGVLSSIARAAAHLCHAPMATIALLTDSPDELEVVGTFGIRAPLRGVRLPLTSSLNGYVMATGRSVRSTDVLRDRRPVLRTIPLMTGARGALAVPLRNREGPFGSLGVAKRMVWHFSNRDVMLLRQLADTASIAIQNAQLRKRLTSTKGHPIEHVGSSPAGPDRCHLSPREREIVELLAAGKTCGEAACVLRLSGRTVEHYLERLKLRFQQHRLPALLAYVSKHTP